MTKNVGKWGCTSDQYGAYCGEITNVETATTCDYRKTASDGMRMILAYKIGNKLLPASHIWVIDTKEKCEEIIAEHNRQIAKERGIL